MYANALDERLGSAQLGPISFTIIPQHNLVLSRISGEITFCDMRNYLKSLASDAHFRAGLNSYYDLSDCTNIVGDLADLTALTQSLSHNSAILPAKTALLLPYGNEKLHQIIKGMVLMTSESPIEHRSFLASEKNLCCQYLGISRIMIETELSRMTSELG